MLPKVQSPSHRRQSRDMILLMKKLALALLLLVASSPALAAHKSTGLGFILGEPTGLSAQFWTRDGRASGGGRSFSFNDFLLLYADYLFHWPGGCGTRTPFIRQ